MINKRLIALLFSFTFFLIGAAVIGCTEPSKSKLPTVDGSFEVNGAVHKFTFEVASTSSDREIGLMYRSSMEDNHGMIFVYPTSSYRSFWMKNTEIPLDIIFLDSNFKIVVIRKNCTPYTLNPRDTGDKFAQFVVELNAGIAEKLGLSEGTTLKLEQTLPKGQEGV